jgi:hypothetical protein
MFWMRGAVCATPCPDKSAIQEQRVMGPTPAVAAKVHLDALVLVARPISMLSTLTNLKSCDTRQTHWLAKDESRCIDAPYSQKRRYYSVVLDVALVHRDEFSAIPVCRLKCRHYSKHFWSGASQAIWGTSAENGTVVTCCKLLSLYDSKTLDT